MNRTIAAVFALLVSLSLFAGEPQRYLVATKRPFKSGAMAAALADARGVAARANGANVVGFETFNGFAATLTESEVAALKKSGEVRWIEPVIERHAAATRPIRPQTVPYGIDLIQAREAWAAKRIGKVNVAVLDTGIDYRHDELHDVFAGGTNIFDKDTSPLDDGGHGTHVAGTIAAADNSVGVVGIAPHVKLWAVKVLNAAGAGSNETIIGGIDWVVAKKGQLGGNWIINLSLGAPRPSSAEREAVNRALDAGILVVAASGNESTPTTKAKVIFPAAYPGVVAVGAIDDDLSIASFSNQGPELDFAAPGVGVLSTVPINTNFITTITTQGRVFDSDTLSGSPVGNVAGDFVYCGVGHPDQFPAAARGKIAVIKRGEMTFAEKARNAINAGAIGVVIFNHSATPINWTLRSTEAPWSLTYDFTIVVTALTQADGEALLKQTGQIAVDIDPDDYALGNGTSMATPHVAGAAALLWCIAPNAKASEVVQALTLTAVDRGAAGVDPAYGAGVINVLAAAKHLAPSAFAPGGPTTGRPMGKRGRG